MIIKMNGKIEKDNLLFYIIKEDLQQEALPKIGRELNEEEIEIARKGIEWGISSSPEIIYHTIFTEMIKSK